MVILWGKWWSFWCVTCQLQCCMLSTKMGGLLLRRWPDLLKYDGCVFQIKWYIVLLWYKPIHKQHLILTSPAVRFLDTASVFLVLLLKNVTDTFWWHEGTSIKTLFLYKNWYFIFHNKLGRLYLTMQKSAWSSDPYSERTGLRTECLCFPFSAMVNCWQLCKTNV